MKPSIAIAVLAWSMAVAAAGQNQSSIASKARLDFERVDAEPIPTIADTATCVQSSAAALPVSRAEERYLIHYRKGYCEIFGATLTGDSGAFQAAVQDFTEAIASWPKKLALRPPAGLRALAAIARIEQGRMAYSNTDLARDLVAVLDDPNCQPTPLMSTAFCTALIDTARTWMGWLAYRKNEFDEAAKFVQPLPGSGWGAWISGRIAQDQKRTTEAASLYQKALEAAAAAETSPNPDVVTLLGPKLDTAAIHYQFGQLEFSRQRYEAAITHLDAAVKASPKNSYAIFLRARSKDALRLNSVAVDDYALAAQTARANDDTSWPVGQAHFNRGLLLYQAKDYRRAEGEFSTALASKFPDMPQADILAWRAMASVAAGVCKSSDVLEAAGKAASSQFPKAQADALVFDCRAKQAATLDQLLSLEKTYSGRLDAAKLGELKALIAGAYADQGVAAEDRKDPYAAVIAYRRAIELNPNNAKARFNLGAIYIEDKRYNLAEAQYRALTQADAGDHEAHYWLAQSILAQHPSPERANEACGLLHLSLAIGDTEKKAQFAKALTAAKCPK